MCCCPLLKILYTEFVYFFCPARYLSICLSSESVDLDEKVCILYAWADKNEFLIRNGNGGTERVS